MYKQISIWILSNDLNFRRLIKLNVLSIFIFSISNTETLKLWIAIIPKGDQ